MTLSFCPRALAQCRSEQRQVSSPPGSGATRALLRSFSELKWHPGGMKMRRIMLGHCQGASRHFHVSAMSRAGCPPADCERNNGLLPKWRTWGRSGPASGFMHGFPTRDLHPIRIASILDGRNPLSDTSPMIRAILCALAGFLLAATVVALLSPLIFPDADPEEVGEKVGAPIALVGAGIGFIIGFLWSRRIQQRKALEARAGTPAVGSGSEPESGDGPQP